jgi:hypothetical protein
VVDDAPWTLLGPASRLVLRRLAPRAAVSECQEARLRRVHFNPRLRTQVQDGGKEGQSGAAAKNIADLLTQLRADVLAFIEQTCFVPGASSSGSDSSSPCFRRS